MTEEELNFLKDCIVNLDFEGAKNAAKECMSRGISPVKVIDNLRAALSVVGEKFENKEYFLQELVIAGEVVKETMKIIEPYLKKQVEFKGKIVLATVKGDIHDIGKNIVGVMLTAAGFEVIDLGVNVPTEKIIEAVRKHRPQVLGLSALLTLTMVEMEAVINTLEKEGLRKSVKVIVGGAPVTEEFAKKIGADHRAEDAVEGVNKCLQWITEEGGD